MKMQDFDKEAFENFRKNRYSRSEYLQVKAWFKQDHQEELEKAMGSQWSEIPAGQPLNDRLAGVLEALKSRLGFPLHRKGRSFLDFYRKAAAVLFVPLLIGSAYWAFHAEHVQQEALASIHSPEGARTEFRLPDGTKGWLNSGSVLTYPVGFSDRREVKIEGEAYFEVVRLNGKPFYVKTDDLTVRVLGTAFNVAAYENDPEISIILKEGKVEVCDLESQPDYVMTPDEKFNYDTDKKTAKVSRVDAASQLAWTQGLLQFRGEPLSEVMKKLSRWYNVDFEIRDRQLRDYNFKATFKDEQLEEILRMIAITTPMKYRIEERKVTKHGVYAKRKIIIEKS